MCDCNSNGRNGNGSNGNGNDCDQDFYDTGYGSRTRRSSDNNTNGSSGCDPCPPCPKKYCPTDRCCCRLIRKCCVPFGIRFECGDYVCDPCGSTNGSGNGNGDADNGGDDGTGTVAEPCKWNCYNFKFVCKLLNNTYTINNNVLVLWCKYLTKINYLSESIRDRITAGQKFFTTTPSELECIKFFNTQVCLINQCLKELCNELTVCIAQIPEAYRYSPVTSFTGFNAGLYESTFNAMNQLVIGQPGVTPPDPAYRGIGQDNVEWANAPLTYTTYWANCAGIKIPFKIVYLPSNVNVGKESNVCYILLGPELLMGLHPNVVVGPTTRGVSISLAPLQKIYDNNTISVGENYQCVTYFGPPVDKDPTCLEGDYLIKYLDHLQGNNTYPGLNLFEKFIQRIFDSLETNGCYVNNLINLANSTNQVPCC